MTVIIIGMTVEETNMIVINITDMDIIDLMDTGRECIYLRLSPIYLLDSPVSISSSQISKLDSEELLCVYLTLLSSRVRFQIQKEENFFRNRQKVLNQITMEIQYEYERSL